MGGIRAKKKKKNNCNKKKKNEDNQENGGIVVDAEIGKISGKKMQRSTIQSIFNCAQFYFCNIREFNRTWRVFVGHQCLGLSFSIVLSAFQKRYGKSRRRYNRSSLLGDGDEDGVGDGVGDGGDLISVERRDFEGGGKVLTSVVKDLNLSDDDDNGGYDDKTDNNNHGYDDKTDNNNHYLDYYLMEEILVRLPLPSFMRAKSVCKTWNTLTEDLNVRGNVDLVTHHIAQGYHGIAFFILALNRWFRITLQWERWRWEKHELGRPCYPGLGLCASGGGLFLFIDFISGDQNDFSPVVFNPLTKQHRVLPHFPLKRGCIPGLASELIAESDHFKVITIAGNGEEPWPLMYNSITNKWTAISITGTTPISSSNSHPWRSTVHDGVMYCTSSYGVHLGCYDIARGELKFLAIEGGLPPLVDCHDDAKNFPTNLPSLVVCRGKVILVGRLQRRPAERSILGRLPVIKHTLVGLWELDVRAKNKSWSFISSTPRNLLEDAVKSSDGTDFLVSAPHGADRILFMLKGSMSLLSFNLNSMEWSTLPGCPAEDMIDTSSRRAFSAPLKILPYL